MKYEIRFDFPFNSKELKIIGLNDSSESNGCFWYDKDYIMINIASGEFEGLEENNIEKLFYKVDTHERLHREIYLTLNKIYNNNIEERFICLMTEQEKWTA